MNAQLKEKQKAFLVKGVRVDKSCSSSAWYRQRLVGTVKLLGIGGLCFSGWGRKKRVKSRASKSIQSHSKRGAGRATQALECTPQTDYIFFRQRNWRAVLREPAFISHALLIPSSAVMCTFENYISMESCESGVSGTRVFMCQWKPSIEVCSNWSDFCNVLGKHRLEKVTERTTSQGLVETLLLFLYVREDFSPSCLLLQPLLPFLRITLCQCLTLLGDIDVNVMTWVCSSWQPVRNATLGGTYFRGIWWSSVSRVFKQSSYEMRWQPDRSNAHAAEPRRVSQHLCLGACHSHVQTPRQGTTRACTILSCSLLCQGARAHRLYGRHRSLQQFSCISPETCWGMPYQATLIKPLWHIEKVAESGFVTLHPRE